MLALLFVSGCTVKEAPNSISGLTNDLCFQNALDAGVIFKREGKVWLRAGEEKEDHFDITGWSLRPCQVSLGYGREFYPALIDPEYVTAGDHPDDYDEEERVIMLESEQGHKIYPLSLMNRHLVVNEKVDGNPVMIQYSIFTDQPAVYRRDYCDTLFTFAVSGYAYWDYGIQNATNEFLLWDRETESLWWPLLKKGVSGQMQGTWMVIYNESRWRVTHWSDVVENFPDALVLKEDQEMIPPDSWPRYFEVSCK